MKQAFATGSQIQTSVGFATGHAGEIFQGALRGIMRTRRLLLSLPAPVLWTQAEVISTPGHALSLHPVWATKAQRAAEHLFVRLGKPTPEVSIRLTTNIPVGKGCGSSTADVLATMRALLSYAGASMPEEALASLVVEVEQASDSSVLSRPALFRHREGTVEEYLPGAFPNLRVIVFDVQPRETINTVSLPRARYSDVQLREFGSLVADLRQAFREGDPRRLGAVATGSARLSQRFLAKPHFETLSDLVAREGGYGVAASHSGTVVSALLPLDCTRHGQHRLKHALRKLGMRVVTQYSLRSANAVAA